MIGSFDLQGRAELAASCLTALLDKQRDGQMYFLANWRARPPRADHCLWDCGDGSGRHVDALTLARTMVRHGSPAAEPNSGDLLLERCLLRTLAGDGLSWLPLEPWAEPWGRAFLLSHWQPGEQVAEISWSQRGALMGLLSRFLRTSDERYCALACRLVDGMLHVALRHSHGLFFPEGYYRASGWHYDQTGLYPGIEEYNAAAALPAIRLYEITGYQPALDLATGVIEFALYHTPCYLSDGRFRPVQEEGQELEGHFHTRSNFILSVLKLGLVLGRREYVAWARQSYEHAKTWGTDFGWFPEGLGHCHGEICCTSDMIEIALLLGKHVDPRYYGDAERFGRNHLMESQLLSIEELAEAVARLPADDTPAPWEGQYSTTENVVASQVGGFASRPTLNDAFHPDAAWMMQCCNAAGVRGLYALWRYAVEVIEPADGNSIRQVVHLRFSVETPTLKVVSHEPAAGQVELTPRRPCQVAVRLPTGATQALVASPAETSPCIRVLPAHDGYVHFALGQGQTATVYYPLAERVAHYEVGRPSRRLCCTGYWRGETLVRIEPPGRILPLYRRSVDPKPVEPALPAAIPIESL